MAINQCTCGHYSVDHKRVNGSPICRVAGCPGNCQLKPGPYGTPKQMMMRRGEYKTKRPVKEIAEK